MTVAIKRSIVTREHGVDVVHLRISDGQPGLAPASITITLDVMVGPFESPAMAHVQREAMKRAHAALGELIQDLQREIGFQNYPPDPRPRAGGGRRRPKRTPPTDSKRPGARLVRASRG